MWWLPHPSRFSKVGGIGPKLLEPILAHSMRGKLANHYNFSRNKLITSSDVMTPVNVW
jgi:hypothetical protein